jgi:hypothetical protein
MPALPTRDDDKGQLVVTGTHRGHLSRIGGGRCRLPAAVHDGPASLSTIDGIRI